MKENVAVQRVKTFTYLKCEADAVCIPVCATHLRSCRPLPLGYCWVLKKDKAAWRYLIICKTNHGTEGPNSVSGMGSNTLLFTISNQLSDSQACYSVWTSGDQVPANNHES